MMNTTKFIKGMFPLIIGAFLTLLIFGVYKYIDFRYSFDLNDSYGHLLVGIFLIPLAIGASIILERNEEHEEHEEEEVILPNDASGSYVFRKMIEDYGWMLIPIVCVVLSIKYLDFDRALSTVVLFSSFCLSGSLLRPRLRNEDPRRFIMGLVAGIGLLVMVVLISFKYLEFNIIFVFVALIPSVIIDYFMEKKYREFYDKDS